MLVTILMVILLIVIIRVDVYKSYSNNNEKVEQVETENQISFSQDLSGKFTWDDYIGNGWHKEQGKMYVELLKSEQIDNIPHLLLVGNGGVGKSHFAKVLAAEAGVKFYEFTAENLKDINEWIDSIRDINHKDIILIDEIHNINKPFAENYLYTILQDNYLNHPEAGKVEFPKVTFIGCTTDPDKIPDSLKQRFADNIHIENYSVEDLAKIIERVYNIKYEPAKEIAKRSAGTPRIAKSYAKSIVNYGKSYNIEIDTELVKEVFDKRKIDKFGLGQYHRRALRALFNSKNNSMGVQSLSSTVRVKRAFFQNDIEPALFYNGFISVSTRGRVLTKKGYEYAKEIGVMT